jgi:hypothetical protein
MTFQGATALGALEDLKAMKIMRKWYIYPLVNIQKTMENHHFKWVNQHKSTINEPFSIAM